MNNYSLGFDIIQNIIKLKWIPEILYAIDCGNNRYNQILSTIQYLSHTELQRKLQVLVQQEVILKTEKDGTVSYVLKDFGKDIVHILHHLEELKTKYGKLS